MREERRVKRRGTVRNTDERGEKREERRRKRRGTVRNADERGGTVRREKR